MFNQNQPEKTHLEEVIDSVLSDLEGEDAGTEKYAQMADQLVKLHALHIAERKPRISPDVKATIAANLAGILVIVGHERTHIVTTKALGFIKKLW